MLADSLASREVDFSHLYLRVMHGNLPEAESAVRSSLQYVLIGFLISILLHALILTVYWDQGASDSEQSMPPRLTVQLKLKSQELTPVETSPLPSGVTEPAEISPKIDVPPPIAQPVKAEPQKQHDVSVKPTVIRPLTATELREFNQQKDTTIDVPATGIAANVFNPALRKQLHEEASKPELQRADAGPKTYTDPSGATIVDLGGGKCLRSSVPRPGEAQNWYMTSCGGKSESEQIMERVNQAVNGKLKFD